MACLFPINNISQSTSRFSSDIYISLFSDIENALDAEQREPRYKLYSNT
jgi:hypothetical protein